MNWLIVSYRGRDWNNEVRRIVSAAALVLLLICVTNTLWGQATPMNIGQTMIDGKPTGTGFVDVLADPSPPYFSSSDTQGYLNVVAAISPYRAASWVVQNLRIPLHSDYSGDFGLSTPGTFSATFDLSGNSLSGPHHVCAAFTPTPYSGGSANFTCTTVMASNDDVGNLLDGAIDGATDATGGPTSGMTHGTATLYLVGTPSTQITGATSLRAIARTALEHQPNRPDGVIESVRLDIPGIQQGVMECVPAAVAQSLEWLAKRDKLGGVQLPPLNQLIQNLKDAMQWNVTNGVLKENIEAGIEKATMDLKLPLTTEHFDDPNGDGTGAFDWIKQQIEAGQDVEVRIRPDGWGGGHMVTVSGWGDDGTKKTLFITDPATGGKAVDSYELDAAGKKMKKYKWVPNAGGAILNIAVAQSPAK
jgi:hypothetical protein